VRSAKIGLLVKHKPKAVELTMGKVHLPGATNVVSDATKNRHAATPTTIPDRCVISFRWRQRGGKSRDVTPEQTSRRSRELAATAMGHVYRASEAGRNASIRMLNFNEIRQLYKAPVQIHVFCDVIW